VLSFCDSQKKQKKRSGSGDASVFPASFGKEAHKKQAYSNLLLFCCFFSRRITLQITTAKLYSHCQMPWNQGLEFPTNFVAINCCHS
jgi:hypothetical protein